MLDTDDILNGYLYKNTVDRGAWTVAVMDQSEDGNSAILRIHDSDGSLVHESTVTIAYAQAIFGADIADIADWEAIAIRVIDHPDERTLPHA